MTAVFDPRAELLLSGAWTNITTYVQRRNDLIGISRGRADEANTVERSTCKMSLDNRTGRFSSRNPVGAYYGQIGRNTPVRISMPGDGTKALRIPGQFGLDNTAAPDVAGFHVTGDIDIRIDVALENWAQYQTLAQRYVASGTSNSWILYLLGSGVPRFAWSANGTADNVFSATAPVSQQPGTRLALRVTLSVSTGTLTFWTAPTISGSWTQLGAPIVFGATSIFAGTAPIVLGETGQPRPGNTSIMAGRIHAFQLLNGIAGTPVANPDFTVQAIGATSFADGIGNTWTLGGQAEITDRRYRFHGEVSSWPQRWDLAGADVYSPIEAAGVLRRLAQGSSPLRSVLYRAITRFTTSPVVAYWPCEDASAALSLASASGGPPMTYTGTPSLASYTGYVASEAIPTPANSVWTGVVPPYSGGNGVQVSFLAGLPVTGMPSGTVIAQVTTTGTAPRWEVAWDPTGGGLLTLNAYDNNGALLTSLTYPYPTNANQAVFLSMRQSGPDIQFMVGGTSLLGGAGSSFATLSGRTIGQATRVIMNPSGAINDTAIGHIVVQSVISFSGGISNSPDWLTTTTMKANSGEQAGLRFLRLCQEEGLVPRSVGDLIADTAAMGPQLALPLLDLLQEVADADGGMLFEPRDVLGLGYRTRVSLYNQTPVATLAYAGNLSGTLEPVDDDQLTRNDWTLSRPGGSSARAIQTTGALSIQAPPNGVGRYDATLTINVQYDDVLRDHAYWHLRLGTVDEARYPVITVDLAAPALLASQALTLAVQALNVGDLLTVTGVPPWLPPDAVQQLMQGFTEQMGEYEYKISANCSPASPYFIGILDDPIYGRADTDGSTLAAGVNSSAVSLSVATAQYMPLWTTAAGDFPFNVRIAGEVMTVTNITGASSPQTFTVTRSVNGVVKAQTTGADVRLAQPMILSL